MTAPLRLSGLADAPRNAGRPRIGYVLGAFPVLSETFVSGEVTAVARRQALGAVFAFDLRAGGTLATNVEALITPVSALPCAPWCCLPPHRLARAVAATSGLGAARQASILRHGHRIAVAARQAGCTHLHAHFGGGAALHGLAAARLAGLSFGLSLHSGAFARNFDDAAAARVLMTRANAVAAATDALAAEARAAGARRVVTITCGADLDRFRPGQDSAHNDRLLSLGRLIDCKGIDTLLRALALIPAHRRPGLDIVGDGPERAALEALARNAGLDAVFLGSRPNGWFAAEGVRYMGFVAPFRPGRDGQVDSSPIALKEALALGLPVITTDLPGPAGIVANAGRIVPTGDALALAREIEALCALSPAMRAAIKQQACARARCFSITAQAEGVIDLAMACTR